MIFSRSDDFRHRFKRLAERRPYTLTSTKFLKLKRELYQWMKFQFRETSVFGFLHFSFFSSGSCLSCGGDNLNPNIYYLKVLAALFVTLMQFIFYSESSLVALFQFQTCNLTILD